MQFMKRLMLVVGVIAAATALATSASGSVGVGAAVQIGSSNLGRILVDAQGKTLYLWAHDKSARSTCYGDCAKYWPPLLTHGRPVATRGANASLLGTTRRSDGQIQVTYGGHPLYYFVQDTKAGQTKGEGLTGFGGRWDPVSSVGTPVQKPPTPSDPYAQTPLQASVISPGPGDSAGAGGTFSVDLSLEARTQQANSLLGGYTSAFNDPNAPTFHPGANASAPGLVVLLSTTPTMPGTPLQGPNTNLAGVFQINDIAKTNGRIRTFNSWIVTSPGFFGKATTATLTVFAVDGTAPALVTGNEKPISNVVRQSFTIAG